MKSFVRYFLHGLVFLAPIVLTGYIFWAVFTAIDGWLGLPVPGLGFLIMLAAVTLTGFVANLFITAPFLRLVERFFERLPFVKLLYGAIKDLLSAVVGEEKRFDKPVLVRVGEGVEVLGFVTRESLDDLGVEGRVAVYLPQSYNFAGQTVVVERERLTPLKASGGDAMTFVVSAGVSSARRPD